MKDNLTPTSVRVARWGAIAAAITALGSVFDTVWSEKPWWKEEAPATHVSVLKQPNSKKSTPIYIAPAAKHSFSSDSVESSSKITQTPELDKSAPISFAKWALFVSIGVGIISAIVEWHHRMIRKKKTQVMFDHLPPAS